MFLGCFKLFDLLCRHNPGLTTQTLLPPGGKSNRPKYRPLLGSHGYTSLTDLRQRIQQSDNQGRCIADIHVGRSWICSAFIRDLDSGTSSYGLARK
jgi:hypothetical protein